MLSWIHGNCVALNPHLRSFGFASGWIPCMFQALVICGPVNYIKFLLFIACLFALLCEQVCVEEDSTCPPDWSMSAICSSRGNKMDPLLDCCRPQFSHVTLLSVLLAEKPTIPWRVRAKKVLIVVVLCLFQMKLSLPWLHCFSQKSPCAVFQMSLVSRVQHPYVVEYKESWVEKVSANFFLIKILPGFLMVQNCANLKYAQ